MNVLEGVVFLLQEAGLGVWEQDVFTVHLPDTPDNAVVISEYPGTGPEYVHNTPAPSYQYPRVQIRVRASDYPSARVRAEAIWMLLGSLHNRELDGVNWECVRPLSDVYQLNIEDERRRRNVVCSYECVKGVA